MPDGHDGHSHAGAGHAGHPHGVSADADIGKLAVALALIVGFMAVEVVVGILANSLALLSDAAHRRCEPQEFGFQQARRLPQASQLVFRKGGRYDGRVAMSPWSCA